MDVTCLLAAWQEVEQKLGDGVQGEPADSPGPVQYTEKTPSAAMKSKQAPTSLTFLSLGTSKHIQSAVPAHGHPTDKALPALSPT